MNIDQIANCTAARALRLGVIQGLFNNGQLTEEQADELLNAPLSPEPISDENPLYDDRDQLSGRVN